MENEIISATPENVRRLFIYKQHLDGDSLRGSIKKFCKIPYSFIQFLPYFLNFFKPMLYYLHMMGDVMVSGHVGNQNQWTITDEFLPQCLLSVFWIHPPFFSMFHSDSSTSRAQNTC